MKKITVGILLVLLCPFVASAQSDWKQIYNENGISISVVENDCKNQMGHIEHNYLMKIENTNTETKSVEWDFQLIDGQGKCIGCSGNSPEQHRIIKIGGNETIEAQCLPKTRNDIKIAMRFTDIKTAREIMEVKIVNVKVSGI